MQWFIAHARFSGLPWRPLTWSGRDSEDGSPGGVLFWQFRWGSWRLWPSGHMISQAFTLLWRQQCPARCFPLSLLLAFLSESIHDFSPLADIQGAWWAPYWQFEKCSVVKLSGSCWWMTNRVSLFQNNSQTLFNGKKYYISYQTGWVQSVIPLC